MLRTWLESRIPGYFAGFAGATTRIRPISGERRQLYLTYDDGPSGGNAIELLELLGQYRARATFFPVGSKAQRHPDIVRRMVSEGHGVGNHTFTHVDPWRASNDLVREELNRADELLAQLAGSETRLVRPPYGHASRALLSWCRDHERQVVLWDVMPGDFRHSANAAMLARRVLRLARPGSIVVLHDGASRTAPETIEATRIILRRLTKQGWTFASLPDWRRTVRDPA